MRVKKGNIIRQSSEKTIVVEVHSYKNHPKYKKRYRVSKKYLVDNPENQKFEIGSDITIYETKPLSKLKHWTIKAPQQ